jgi:hypothetical protein
MRLMVDKYGEIKKYEQLKKDEKNSNLFSINLENDLSQNVYKTLNDFSK